MPSNYLFPSGSGVNAESHLVPGPGKIIIGGLDGPVAMQTPFALRGNTVAALGDSITAGNGGDAVNVYVGGQGYFWLAGVLSNGRMQPIGWNGVSGNTTAQMLTRVGDVIALQPAACFVLGGTNDIGTGVPFATTTANLMAIYQALIGAGILPIPITMLPKSGYLGQANQLAAWNLSAANRLGIPCVDVRALLFDPATGDWKAGYSGDGTHPTAVVHQIIAQAVVDQVGSLFPPYAPPLAVASVDSGNVMNPNALFLTDSNSDGLADNWTIWDGATAIATLSAASAPAVGNWQQIAATSTTQVNFQSQQDVAVTAGDLLEVSLRLQTTLQATSSTLTIKLITSDFARITEMYHIATDVNGVVILRGKVPAGKNDAYLLMQLENGGSFKLSQATLRNLTALGLA